MESELKRKKECRERRALRVRYRLRGTQDRPRLCVVKTNRHIHVQVIDDEAHVTLASTSTMAKEFQKTEIAHKNKASAKQLGLKIAALCGSREIKQVVLDRGCSKYHGVVAALADGAREGGLVL